MKNKGFTLIELLAVIIILGILMIIAIPSVTKYINDSRKSAYIDTAKQVISGAKNLVNSGKLEMYDTSTTYYIPNSCIKVENGEEADSPYGKFTKAYVVVIFDGKGYNYYWTSVDDTGTGIKNIISVDKLDEDNIESDLKEEDIDLQTIVEGRKKYKIFSDSDCSSYTDGQISRLELPEGKTRDDLVVGDLVSIGTEEFYVIKNNTTNNELTLLAHYNLNVGDNKYSGAPEGLQNNHVMGYVINETSYGTIKFSNNAYWINIDEYYNNIYNENEINCVVANYIKEYVSYLESLGVSIKESRILKREELYDDFRCSGVECNSAPSFIVETSYWLGSAKGIDSSNVWAATTSKTIVNRDYSTNNGYGVRPVIVI